MQVIDGFVRGKDNVWRKRRSFGRHIQIERIDAHGRLIGAERIHRPHGLGDHLREDQETYARHD